MLKRCSIKDLPLCERPVERLWDKGPESLSISELLAIIIGSGTLGVNALMLSEKIIAETGVDGLINMDLEQLTKFQGIGKKKASRIVASFELYRRVSFSINRKEIKEINTGYDAYRMLSTVMKDRNREIAYAIYLSSNNRVIDLVKLSTGTRGHVEIEVRNIVFKGIVLDADKIIIGHNHPSGELVPSNEDMSFTRVLEDQCKLFNIKLVDHIVITNDGYTSIISGVKFINVH